MNGEEDVIQGKVDEIGTEREVSRGRCEMSRSRRVVTKDNIAEIINLDAILSTPILDRGTDRML